MTKNKPEISKIWLFTLFAVFILFLTYRLGTSMFNADQHFWFERTQKFTKAVLEKRWADTYQNAKPGVTVMWLSGVSLETFMRIYEKVHHFRPQIYTHDTFKYVDSAVKLPLVAVTAVSMVFLFFAIRTIFGNNIALASTALLAFQPYFVGISRYFHGDGTLTALMLLSVISIFIFLQRRKFIFLIFSGAFAGAAFLTKMQGIYLFAYIPFILFLHTLIFKKHLPKFIQHTALWFATAIFVIFALFPALWVKPIDTFKDMFREAGVVTEQGRNGGEGSNLVYTKAILKIFSPFNLIFFAGGVSYLLRELTHGPKNIKQNIFYFYALIFIACYFGQMALVFQKSERYLLPLFPMVSLIAGYGIVRTINGIKPELTRPVVNLLVVVLILYTATFAPHYTAMAEEAPWGSLYVEAANYLNAKPKAQNLHVVANPKEHTFRPFFAGKTYGKGETLPDNRKPDYVVAANRFYLPEKYSYCKPEHQIIFMNKVFWEIYKCK